MLEVELWSQDEVRGWADEQIMLHEEPPFWLVDLCMSRTLPQAQEFLGHELRCRETTLPGDLAQLMVGFTYLRFQMEQIDRERMFLEVFDILDASEAYFIDRNQLRRASGGNQYDIEALELQLTKMSRPCVALLDHL